MRTRIARTIPGGRATGLATALGWLLAAVGSGLAQPTLQFTSSSFSVNEAAGAVTLTVQRQGDLQTAVGVDYATADGTATNGLKYTAVGGTLAFGAGETNRTIVVPILNDGLVEDTKNFKVILSNPTNAVLGTHTNITVSITDNDGGVQFVFASYSVAEDAGAVLIGVVRGDDGEVAVTVDVATSDLAAINGRDYTGVTNTLAFAPADSKLAIRRDRDVNILTWTGDVQLQRADRVEGPWQTLAAARSPYNVGSPVPVAFYQVRSPRPATLYVPSSYNGQTAMPLMILLHGAGGTGEGEDAHMKLRPLAEKHGFLCCFPDGLITPQGFRGWQWALWNNETDVSAFFVPQGYSYYDEVGYLRGLIEETAARFAVDRKRVYVLVYSNGAFMAYRMAYEAADLVAGIVGLAAVTRIDGPDFLPSEPVNILHVHGTSDHFYISYVASGAPLLLGAVRSTEIWAGYNGAHDPVTDPAPTMDLDLDVPGLDTVVTRYTSHPPGGAVELWTINGGSHGPTLSSEFSPRVIDWLLAHPKP